MKEATDAAAKAQEEMNKALAAGAVKMHTVEINSQAAARGLDKAWNNAGGKSQGCGRQHEGHGRRNREDG